MNRSLFTNILLGTLLLLSSCGDKNEDPIVEGSDKISVGQASTTSFTASLSGTFTGISKVDLALGKYGVLYCEKTDNAGSIFKSWKDGNDNPDCIIFDKGIVNGESFTGTISGLNPETEYSYCLFSQNKDKTAREISKVNVFKTTSFNPNIKTVNISDIHYIDAVASVSLDMDEKDASCCTMEILVSENENCNEENSIIFPYNERFNGMVKVELDNLESNKTFYCRLFIKYATSSGLSGTVYGPETRFTTKDLMELAVDLGLPSGIMWANCSMGDYSFASSLDNSPVYYWGSSRKMVTYVSSTTGKVMKTEVDYEHIDSNGAYKYLGKEISGTEYDVVHQLYGGKWRMPTKTDIEELIEKCTLGNKNTLYHTHYVELYNYQDGVFRTNEMVESVEYFEVIGLNRNSIRFRTYDDSWSGTMEDDNNIYYLRCQPDPSNNYAPKMTLSLTNRRGWKSIRPVWDPNMPD